MTQASLPFGETREVVWTRCQFGVLLPDHPACPGCLDLVLQGEQQCQQEIAAGRMTTTGHYVKKLAAKRGRISGTHESLEASRESLNTPATEVAGHV